MKTLNEYSNILKRDVEISIYIPEVVKKDVRIIYMTDGHNLFDKNKASFNMIWDIEKNLKKLDSKYDYIVVGVDAPQEDAGLKRVEELSFFPMGELALGYMYDRFDYSLLAKYRGKFKGLNTLSYFKELVGREKELTGFEVTRENRVIMGSSMGGVFSFNAALNEPALFGNAGCLSSAFWINEHKQAEILRRKKMDNVKLYMDTGDSEIEPESEFKDAYIDSNILIADMVGNKLHVIKGGIHNETSWGKRFNEIIVLLEEE